MVRATLLRTVSAVFVLGLIAAAISAVVAADGIQASHEGVQVFAPQAAFQGDLGALVKGSWETAPLDKLPQAVTGQPVLASATLVAAVQSDTGEIAIFTRQGDRLTKRGQVAVEGVKQFKSYKLVRSEKPARLGIEIYSQPEVLELSLYLSPDGILEFKPGKAQRLALRGARLQYGIVPSFLGVDFVYGAKTEPDLERLYLAATNLVVGLVEGGDCMLVGAWPAGKQRASLQREPASAAKLFDGLALDTAGASFYLGALEKPEIWRVEPLKPGYLEKDTPIAWKRPFDAKWIGRFYVGSEEVNYPFYFHNKREKVWGRWVRSYFYYPLWFDGDKAIMHFEKTFPPKGEMLIYYLERQSRRAEAAIASPLEIMETALGKEQAAKLLDLEGVSERVVLFRRKSGNHGGSAVCAMTELMQKYFDAGEEVKRREEIEEWCDGVSKFIGVIRDRINEYSAFAAQMKVLLAAQAKANPKLAEAAAELEQVLAEMEEARASGMPPTSLETVKEWTEAMKKIAVEVLPGNAKKSEQYAVKCRSVAGSQDDLTRKLCLISIRLTEEAARLGLRSPEHAKLADEVIAKARGVIRKPTLWEPRRY